MYKSLASRELVSQKQRNEKKEEKENKGMSKCILGIEQPCDECRMCNTKEVQINPELEQKYKELAAAVKESGIPLDIQKELQKLIDKEYIGKSNN